MIQLPKKYYIHRSRGEVNIALRRQLNHLFVDKIRIYVFYYMDQQRTDRKKIEVISIIGLQLKVNSIQMKNYCCTRYLKYSQKVIHLNGFVYSKHFKDLFHDLLWCRLLRRKGNVSNWVIKPSHCNCISTGVQQLEKEMGNQCLRSGCLSSTISQMFMGIMERDSLRAYTMTCWTD